MSGVCNRAFKGLATACVICVGLTVVSFAADTHYVNGSNPSPDPPYTNWATASTNIQLAINEATDGDEVLVTNGTYVLASQISITNGITVRSVSGTTNTIVDGNTSTRCFYLNDTNAVVGGFTITRGGVFDGAGVYIDQGGLVQNCNIVTNQGGWLGGGVYVSGRGRVLNCRITGNISAGGGGIVLDASLSPEDAIAENCTISGNAGINGGGVAFLRMGGTLRNSLVVGSVSAGTGAGIAFAGTNGILDSCTVSSNSGGDGAGITFYSGGGVIRNTIVWGNTASGTHPNIWLNGFEADISYTCTDTNFPGLGNKGQDPLFIDALAGDFLLQYASPCIDAGTNLAWMAGATDLDGFPRVKVLSGSALNK